MINDFYLLSQLSVFYLMQMFHFVFRFSQYEACMNVKKDDTFFCNKYLRTMQGLNLCRHAFHVPGLRLGEGKFRDSEVSSVIMVLHLKILIFYKIIFHISNNNNMEGGLEKMMGWWGCSAHFQYQKGIKKGKPNNLICNGCHFYVGGWEERKI